MQTCTARQAKAARDAAAATAGHAVIRRRRQPWFPTRMRAEMHARIEDQEELAAVDDARGAGPPWW